MLLTILEKKLVGDAKGFYCKLSSLRESIEVILKDLRRFFETDTLEIAERFRQLSFHETDYKRAARQLQESRTLISLVRRFLEKLPGEMIRVIRLLFDDGSQPLADDIIDKCDRFLNNQVFVDRYRAAKVFERLNEVPEESVMNMSVISSEPTKLSENFARVCVSTLRYLHHWSRCAPTYKKRVQP
ncbi:hypothetical protein GCK72_011533 [Caenorhabditis remanei]|uniref:Uncharacterized protein n=1 Tax=Caenorhabditis remanei TaxID=31234 RepID=A0A6A5H7V2_CAERE|nr:hypothetical protein GCK72_011533 [Caenorhabditis remanei]KAF1763267.1 hypothetical protein GCK72_011533 [Caenorhabditis remanei]